MIDDEVGPPPGPGGDPGFDLRGCKVQTLNRFLLPLRYTYLHPKYQRFIADFREFIRLADGRPSRFEIQWKNRFPCLDDRTAITSFDPHYTYHPAWAARIVVKTRPAKHIDIGSTLTFCTMVSANVPVEFYDIRPARLDLSNLECKRGDLMSLPFSDGSVSSLSCMHVVEHVGLGRYGDPIDPDGDLKAMAELKRVLGKGGSLLFVTPVGRPTIRFNAHRIYSYEQIAGYFDSLHLQEFALVDDRGSFIEHAGASEADRQEYGCGCWWFTK